MRGEENFRGSTQRLSEGGFERKALALFPNDPSLVPRVYICSIPEVVMMNLVKTSLIFNHGTRSCFFERRGLVAFQFCSRPGEMCEFCP